MIDYLFRCEFCGIERKDAFINQSKLENYQNNWKNTDKCPICELTDKINKFIKSTLLNIHCTSYGKYLFTIDDTTSEINKSMGFSPRMDRKGKINIYYALDELNIKHTYFLLASYLETSYSAIKLTYKKIKENSREIRNFGKINQLYSNISNNIKFENYSSISYCGGNNFFRKNGIKQPRYNQEAEVIRLIANVFKHCDGIIQNERSGKRLIDTYGFQEGHEILTYIHTNIKNTRPSLKLSDIHSLTFRIYIFLKDFISIIFSCPNLKERKLDMGDISSKILDFKLRKKSMAMLFKDLKKEGLIRDPTLTEIKI